MSPPRIRRAVVLAAGRGTRLASMGAKPLLAIRGEPLLGWVLRALLEAGLKEVVVVTGADPAVGRWALGPGRERARRWGATVTVRSVARSDGNATTLLAVEDGRAGGAVVSMADHVYPATLVRRVLAAPAVPRLAIDRDVEACLDLADATKVRCVGGQIVALGKDITPFDALDCGVFAIDEAWLDQARRSGGRTLTDVAQRCDPPLHAVDVTGVPWLDVDSPRLLARAEQWCQSHGAWFEEVG